MIIEPEEIRLKGLEDQATTIKERAARAELLPMRREMLAGLELEPSLDGFLLDMDKDQFISYLNECQAQKNERDRIHIEHEKAALVQAALLAKAAEEAKIAERTRIEAERRADEDRRVNEAAQAKIEAQEAAQKVIDDAKAEADRVLQAAKDKVEQEAAQAEAEKHAQFAREQQAKDEAVRAEKQEKYIAWTREMGVTDATEGEYESRHTPAGIELWKRAGIYNPTPTK